MMETEGFLHAGSQDHNIPLKAVFNDAANMFRKIWNVDDEEKVSEKVSKRHGQDLETNIHEFIVSHEKNKKIHLSLDPDEIVVAVSEYLCKEEGFFGNELVKKRYFQAVINGIVKDIMYENPDAVSQGWWDKAQDMAVLGEKLNDIRRGKKHEGVFVAENIGEAEWNEFSIAAESELEKKRNKQLDAILAVE